MKNEFNSHRDIWSPYLTFLLQIWANGTTKTSPYFNESTGVLPQKKIKSTKQVSLTRDGIFLNLIQKLPLDYQKVNYFDLCADDYELATYEFKASFVNRIIEILSSLISPNFYILDASCGPGAESKRLSYLVPNGEVIGVDLSTKMMKRAFRNIKLEKIRNVSFIQADVNLLPSLLTNHFDLIFCNFSFHLYNNVEQVLNQFYKVLQKKGYLVIIDPRKSIIQQFVFPMLKNAIPQIQRFYSLQEMEILLEGTGFKVLYFEKIQEDIGLTIAERL